MGTKGTIFITGATGLVGSLLMITALRAGYSVRLLVRRRKNRSAEERVRSALDVFGFSRDEWHQRQPDIETYEGDIAQPQFGLSHKEWRKSAEGLSAIYHAAAYCGFQNNEIAKSTAVNVEGTRNILKFADMSRTHLFYISSAYIVGDAENPTLEQELERPRRWKNPYEETKFIAERHVHSHCRGKGLRYTVFRPAILIGESVHGRTIRFNSIYHYMKLFHHLATRRKASPVILEAKPGASLNILPVDFAIDAIWDISQSPECEGKIFHITNPSPPKFTDLSSMAERVFGLRIEFSEGSLAAKAISNKGAKKTGDPFSRYRPYMFGEPHFDLTNTRSLLTDYDASFPDLDEPYFRKILDYAVAHGWGKHALPLTCQESEKSPVRFTDCYFREFLPGKLNQQLIENLKNLSAVVSINIQDEKTSNWALEIKGGMLKAVSQDSLPVECRYLLDAETFEQIARGRLQPQQAFFDGRANIEGDMERALQVATALSEFCKSHPFDPEDDPE
jgi:nucleoside-diphosphate-sugar epimerase/putative sterol carrier protein